MNFEDLKKQTEQIAKHQSNFFSNLEGDAAKKDFLEEFQKKFLYPFLGPNGEDSVIIGRFIPCKVIDKNTGLPQGFIKEQFHRINGKKFICNGMTGHRCLLCEQIPKWDEDDMQVQAKYKTFKRNYRYRCWFYIKSHEFNPELNGQLRVLMFPKELFDTIKNSATENGINVFSLFEDGADFKIKVTRNDQGFPRYAFSTFARQNSEFKPNRDDQTPETVFNETEDLYSMFEFDSEETQKKIIEKEYYDNNSDTESQVYSEHVKHTKVQPSEDEMRPRTSNPVTQLVKDVDKGTGTVVGATPEQMKLEAQFEAKEVSKPTMPAQPKTEEQHQLADDDIDKMLEELTAK